MEERNIDTLKEEVSKLYALLKDPHPGFMTWGHCVRIQLKSIASYLPASDLYALASQRTDQDNEDRMRDNTGGK